MARRSSKHRQPPRPLSASLARAEIKQDGRWVVRTITGQSATKTYLCPGCLHDIARGVPHLVIWPSEPSIGSASPISERRHWHTPCWQRRR